MRGGQLGVSVVGALALGACAGQHAAPRSPAMPSAAPASPAAASAPGVAAAPPAPALPVPAVPAPPPKDTLVLVVVGDVGLNRTNLEVNPGGVLEGGGVTPWTAMTTGLTGLGYLKGDLTFMNLETVVTARNDLPVANKGQEEPFFFRSHPDGVRYVVGLGFNLISGANNHAYDFGEAGVRETVATLRDLAARGVAHYAGIGLDRDEASRPAELDVGGAHVAFSAIGNVTNMNNAHRAGVGKPGTMGYRHDEDWQLVTSRLAATPADLRLLSIHYGTERDIRVDDRQRREYRFATAERGVDVVIGHHAHVVRGIEWQQGKLIFYGLGNFLIRGAADIGTRPDQHVCCDFGLLARVHLVRGAGGHFAPRAVEVVPMGGMNRAPAPLPPAEARERVEVLNVLAESLDDAATGSVGVRFAARDDGTGLACAPGADAEPGEVGALCRGFPGPTAPTDEVRARVRAAPDPSQPPKVTTARGKAAARGKPGKRAKVARRRGAGTK
jgi:poly-gamma-glutamate capsule biosynthesis protein CapA/YwtB (metallophosphatase superfamily)